MDVLIVEDDKVLVLLLSKMVEKMQLQVVATTGKGQDAIIKATELNPDLILMDIMLEDDVDGIDAVKSMRKLNQQTPVIFITGNSDPYNKERAQDTNYIDYLIKPVSYEDLRTSVEKIGKKKEANL